MSLTLFLLVLLILAPCFSSSSTVAVCPPTQAIPSGVSYRIIITQTNCCHCQSRDKSPFCLSVTDMKLS